MEQAVVEKPQAGRPEPPWSDERKPGALAILWQRRELIASLTLRDIRSRYKQSVLGVAWALLQPLAMMVVYTVVFSHIARIPTGGIPYPVFTYIALLPWTFFATGLITGTECLVSNFNLITKIYFPREVFPIAAILGKTVDLGLGLLVLAPLLVVYREHVHLTWRLALVPPLLLIQVGLLLGLTFMLSSWNLFYRDIRHAVPLLTQMWFFMTPIVYGLDMVPRHYLPIYMLNPMAATMDGFRKAVLEGKDPMWGYVALAAAVSAFFLVAGYRGFKRLEPAFAETI